MEPRQFEELVAAIFEKNGFDVELTPASRDGGIDILAVKHSELTGDNLYLIECKRYEKTRGVGLGIVQRMLGVVTNLRATKGVVVTTSYFTEPARDFAANIRHVLSLNDYCSVTTWLRELLPTEMTLPNLTDNV